MWRRQENLAPADTNPEYTCNDDKKILHNVCQSPNLLRQSPNLPQRQSPNLPQRQSPKFIRAWHVWMDGSRALESRQRKC